MDNFFFRTKLQINTTQKHITLSIVLFIVNRFFGTTKFQYVLHDEIPSPIQRFNPKIGYIVL